MNKLPKFKLPQLLLLLIAPWLVLLSSCERTEVDSTIYGIDPTEQADMLNRALRLYGQLNDGEMPEPTGDDIIVNGFANAVEISAGVKLFLPYNTNANDNICKVYLQVRGAESYWESPVEYDSISQAPFITISVPGFVQEGDFELDYSVQSCDGEISRVVTTSTLVSPPASCGTSFSGQLGITVRNVDLGDQAGTVSVTYEMYSVPDRLDLRYGNRWVGSTGVLLSNSQQAPNCSLNDGFVSGSRTLTFDYDPDEGRNLQVYVSGCFSGTAWDLEVSCPQ